MINDALDYTTDTIMETFDLDGKYERLIRLALIIGAGWIALKFVKAIVSRKE